MTKEQGAWAALTAAALGALLWYSLRARPGSRGSCLAKRAFWAGAAVLVGGALGGPGWSLCTWGLTAALGLPGYGAAAALSLLTP